MSCMARCSQGMLMELPTEFCEEELGYRWFQVKYASRYPIGTSRESLGEVVGLNLQSFGAAWDAPSGLNHLILEIDGGIRVYD